MQKYSNLVNQQNNWRKDLINKKNGEINLPPETVQTTQKGILNC